MPSGDVKLTDFSLSIKHWSPDDSFEHQVCTTSHRPIECVRGLRWGYPLDIWSLGCTFYEIAYGQTLLSNQEVKVPESIVVESKKEGPASNDQSRMAASRLIMKNRLIHAHCDWAKRHPMGADEAAIDAIIKPADGTDYVPFVLADRFKDPSMVQFNDLILRMLQIDPAKRLSIVEVVNHPFFKGLPFVKGEIITTPLIPIPRGEYTKLERYIQKYKESNPKDRVDRIVQKLTIELFSRCQTLVSIPLKHKAATCLFIASKLIDHIPVTTDIPLPQMVALELLVCQHLSFQLHVSYDLKRDGAGPTVL
jgi:serine/threonine protein kinase